MDKGQLDKTRKILRAVLLISSATGEDGEKVLDRVIQPAKKGPDPAGSARPVLVMRASA